jgi:hypothetical protein
VGAVRAKHARAPHGEDEGAQAAPRAGARGGGRKGGPRGGNGGGGGGKGNSDGPRPPCPTEFSGLLAQPLRV